MTDTPTPCRLDLRCALHGSRIPTSGYCDQPYIVRANDGHWVCVVTTAPGGHEGMSGQSVVCLRSPDHGQTWSEQILLEPFDGPESSYAVILKTPGGRIYVFYNHNTDRVAQIPREDGGVYKRVDCLGHYVFKYSDDHGRTWSAQRYEVPIRPFACDLSNPFGGKLRYFWNVGRPIIARDGSVYLPHSKVGSMGKGFYAQSEGVFLHSDNILTEPDPARIRWETLPDGDVGLRPPLTPTRERVGEEHTIVELSDGSFYCVYRTLSGYPACSYSRDGGHTWSTPRFKSTRPAGGGRRFKQPRAANFVWKCGNGHFLYWFHNQGGERVRDYAGWIDYESYLDRNPAWVSAGHEIDTPEGKAIAWSEPEIFLYDDDPGVRMSYPDLIEENGRFWVSETQKTLARVHPVDPRLMELIFRQHELDSFATEGLLRHEAAGETTGSLAFPALPPFRICNLGGESPCDETRKGFTLDFLLDDDAKSDTSILIDTFNVNGAGLRLTRTADRRLQLEMGDGRQVSQWVSDPISPAEGGDALPHHVSLIVDGGPRAILFIIDGSLHDGGDGRQFGWGRFSHSLVHCNGRDKALLSPAISDLRIYGRALYVSEAVGNFRAHAGRLSLPMATPALGAPAHF
jgi:hypothetical protein